MLLIGTIACVVVLLPVTTSAASYKGELSGWIPWWQDTKGLESATKNIKKLDTVYPFVFEVESASGKIVDRANLKEAQWQKFFSVAKKERVEVIPTIAWFDGPAIHETLSNTKKRRAHIAEIIKVVKAGNFAGINIDYEQKEASTIDHFSTFLKELNQKLGKKLLTCAIEARTPAKDLYRTIPEPLTYANDYKAIGKYCDRIELMTYDQQRADLSLNDARRGVPYAPVADSAWVEKVVELALKDFPENKVLLGVPTYGRAWDVTVAPDWYKNYTRVASLNQPRILELAEKYNAPIGRSAGGEAVISYFPEDSPWTVLNQLPTPNGTLKGYEAAAKALVVATTANIEVPVRFITWSDGEVVVKRKELADKHNLRGVVFFKIDGEEDPKLWR